MNMVGRGKDAGKSCYVKKVREFGKVAEVLTSTRMMRKGELETRFSLVEKVVDDLLRNNHVVMIMFRDEYQSLSAKISFKGYFKLRSRGVVVHQTKRWLIIAKGTI